MADLSSVSMRVRLFALPECVRLLPSGLRAVDVATGPTIVTAVVTRTDLERLAEGLADPTKVGSLSGKIAYVERGRIVLHRCWVRLDTRDPERRRDDEQEREARQAERLAVEAEVRAALATPPASRDTAAAATTPEGWQDVLTS
jgi:hypothetical protein